MTKGTQMKQAMSSPAKVAGAGLVIGLVVAAIVFVTNLDPAGSSGSSSRAATPTGFEGHMTFMATGSFPPAEPALLGPEGERFHREVMGRTDAEIAEGRADAIARFQEQYGLDFSGGDRLDDAMFGPFVMHPDYDYRLYTMAGQSVPSEGWKINDGGFLFMTTRPTTLHGTWGGPDGTEVPGGTVAMVGDYRIDRMTDGELDPLTFSYRDVGPMIPDRKGRFYFQCEIESPELGAGLIQGVWAPEELPDGRMRANTRTVVTFPALGHMPQGGAATPAAPATEAEATGLTGHGESAGPARPATARTGSPSALMSGWVWLSLALSVALVALAYMHRPARASARCAGPSAGWCLWLAILGVLGFQIVHFGEHVAQAVAWLANPGQPYMTPWATSGARGLTVLTTGLPSMGTEMLHLLGNVVFLGGLAAVVALSLRLGLGDLRLLRLAVGVQAVHVVEHTVLTMSSLLVGRAIGLSNLFGLVDPATEKGAALRVWVHFSWNLAATVLAVLAFRELVRRVSPPAVRTLAPASLASNAPLAVPAATPATS